MEISIDFTRPPRKGRTQLPFRVHLDDRQDIEKAASIVGVSNNQYIMTVMLQVSRQIIANKDKFNGQAKNKSRKD